MFAGSQNFKSLKRKKNILAWESRAIMKLGGERKNILQGKINDYFRLYLVKN